MTGRTKSNHVGGRWSRPAPYLPHCQPSWPHTPRPHFCSRPHRRFLRRGFCKIEMEALSVLRTFYISLYDQSEVEIQPRHVRRYFPLSYLREDGNYCLDRFVRAGSSLAPHGMCGPRLYPVESLQRRRGSYGFTPESRVDTLSRNLALRHGTASREHRVPRLERKK